VGLGRGLAMMGAHIAVETTLAIDVDTRRRHPVALLIGPGEEAVRRDAQADWMTKAGRKYLRLRAVLAHAQQAATGRRLGVAGLEEVEVALPVGFQAGVERVLAAAGVPVIAETLVEVSLAITIDVVQSRQLSAFEDVNNSIDYLQPQRLIQAGGEAFPGQFLQFIVGALDHAYVTV